MNIGGFKQDEVTRLILVSILCMVVMKMFHVSSGMLQSHTSFILGAFHVFNEVLHQGIVDLPSSLDPNQWLLTIIQLEEGVASCRRHLLVMCKLSKG